MLLELLVRDELKIEANLARQLEEARIQEEEMRILLEEVTEKAIVARSLLQARQERYTLIQASITEKRLSLSPALRLPTEMLGEIFKWWSDSLWEHEELQHEEGKWTENRSSILPCALRVCKSWNAVAMGCSQLWSRVHVSLNNVLVEDVEPWLKHSKSHPLSLRINAECLEDCNIFYEFFTLIMPETKRCISIDITCDRSSNEEVLAFFHVPFPALKHLWLDNFAEGEPIEIHNTFLFQAPQLTHCFLRDTPFPTSTPHLLRVFSFYVTQDRIFPNGVDRLQDLHHLHRLSLSLPPDYPLIWTCPPSVRYLACDGSSLARVRPASEGQKVFASVQSLCYQYSSDCVTLYRIMQDHHVRLQELILKSVDLADEEWQTLLASQPTLHSLTLTHFDQVFPLRPLIASDPWLCPKLRYIKISSCNYFTGDDIIELLKVRRTTPMPAGLARLETCIVEHCDAVSDRHYYIINSLFEVCGKA